MLDDQQQEVVIVDGKGTEHVFPPGFDPKRAAAIVRNGGSAALPTHPVSAEDFTEPTALGKAVQSAKDVGIGALKGLGSTVAGLGDMAANAGLIPGVVPSAFNSDMRNPVLQRADDLTTASNTSQRVGKVGEQLAEMALPVAAGAKAIPRIARAGQGLQDVMSVAKNVPVNVEAPGQAALRIQQLADRGGTMPRMVRQFLSRTTDPNQAPLTYEEGRDFASNISRLSADEYQRLTPVIQREVGNMRAALNGSLQDAAGTVGKGDAYADAMKEYAQAAKLRSTGEDFLTGAKRALPYAIGGGATGAGYAALNKLVALLNGGK